MKELGKWQNLAFKTGALLLLAGLVMRLFLLPASCWVTSVGVLLFVCMQMLARYDGADVVILRLRRQQLLSDVVFLLMAGLMVMQDCDLGAEWTKGNSWMLCLFIGAFLQIYTVFRLPRELRRTGED